MVAGPVRVGIGAAVALARTLRPLADVAARPPLLPERYWPGHLMHRLADAGRDQRRWAMLAALRYFRQLVPAVVTEILDQLDLTTLIQDRIDVDVLASRIDVDALVARADLDAIVARLDLGGLAGYLVAAEAGQDLRIQSIEADEAVAAWADRVFRR